MPNLSDRQAAREALKTAYLVNLVAESKAMLVDSNTESSSSGSSSSSSADSVSMQPPMSLIFIDAMADLYARHYLNEWRAITKTSDNIHLLLGEHKVNRPEIFRAYM